MTDENRIVVPNSAHSRTGASGAHRWMNCPGSLPLTEKLVDNGDKIVRSGLAADEGTAAHLVAADCLIHDREPWEYAGYIIEVDGNEFTVDEGMTAAVQVYVEHVRAKMEQFPDAVLHVERMMSSVLDEDAYGTADVVIEVPDDRIIVMDYKHGIGVVVEPWEEQLKEYGYLALENYDGDATSLKVVELHVVQPRAPHPKGPVRRHVTNPDELTEFFIEELIPAMQRTRDPDAPLVIGNWCRFCPAREKCPALQRETLDLDASLDPVYMNGDELGRILDKIEAIKKYGESLEQEAFRRVMRGEEVAGRKLVRKQANRVFKDGAEDAARERWGDKAYEPPKFMTPPKVEKLEGGKDFVTRWAYTPDTGLTVAPESDKRDAAKPPMEAYLDEQDSQQTS